MKILSNVDFRQISSRVQENTIRISGRCFQTKKISGKKKNIIKTKDYQTKISGKYFQDFRKIFQTKYYSSKKISVRYYPTKKISDRLLSNEDNFSQTLSNEAFRQILFNEDNFSQILPNNPIIRPTTIERKKSFQTTNYRTK